jgi:hypothetical protein
MQIEILYFDGCPNHIPTVARVQQVLADLEMQAKVHQMHVTSVEDAAQRRFLGSPTVRVNGVDIDPSVQGRTDYGLSCRLYRGRDGVPPATMLRAAFIIAQQTP